MKPSAYRTQWQAMQHDDAAPDDLKHLAHRIALSFLDHYYYNDRFDGEYIRLLCDMAGHFDDDDRARIASGAIFGTIIERLCDDFEDMQVSTYNRVMCLVISFCRQMPGGEELDERLSALGLDSVQALFDRVESARRDSHKPRLFETPPERIYVLSRVTMGADVAITSVIIQRLQRVFGEAEIVLVGTEKLGELFGSCPRLSIGKISYPRRGGLFDRIKVWLDVLDLITRAGGGRALVVDTDSRLSQLGVLPLTAPENYLFFNSRANATSSARMSVSQLANDWMDRVFGQGEFCYPKVYLSGDAPSRAERFAKTIRAAGCKKLTVVSFGVGGNERKCIGGDFSRGLLQGLLAEPGTVVVLDKGFGDAELRLSGDLIDAVARAGGDARDVSFTELDGLSMSGGLLAVTNSIGEIAALISQCDEYIGYDSACKHIAAALGIPSCTVFAGTNVPRFVWRWRGCGVVTPHIVHVDTLTHPDAIDADEVISRILTWREE